MSVFRANATTIGVVDFKIIDINPSEVASALQVYLERGSKLTGVSLDDISTSVCKLPDNVGKVTLAELLAAGMKLFDAIVWLHAARPASHPLVVDAAMMTSDIVSGHEIARSVFYVYFFLVTQARYPMGSDGKDPLRVPNFLKVIMGMGEPQEVYVQRICTFAPQKFDPSWVKYVNFSNFGQEAISRFGLGVAGYRLFGPFKLYEPEKPMNDALTKAVTFAKTVASSPPTWDIHPLTRKADVLTKRGNLNKNLGNLILDVFTETQIQEMVSAKILYSVPVREPSQRNYLTWASGDDISGINTIFRA